MENCLAVQSVINIILQSEDRDKKKEEIIKQINDGVRYKEKLEETKHLEKLLEREG